jgi:hypothetical protein
LAAGILDELFRIVLLVGSLPPGRQVFDEIVEDIIENKNKEYKKDKARHLAVCP